MWRGIAAIVVICAPAIAAPARARAMIPHNPEQRTCKVIQGEKLLASAGGANALCAEVKRAIAVAAPRARYSAEVKVLPRSRLSTSLIVNGRALPDQKFAAMDSDLSESMVRRFAEGIAIAVADAAKP